MSSQVNIKKARASRTSSTQYEALLSYMELHSEFATGKFLTKEGRMHHTKQWEELANKLNTLCTGGEKTTKQWQTVWRDMKSIACKKASKLRNERNRTGNFPITAQPLTAIDQRVISCIGLQYVQGSVNCPDSTPEEEEDQLRLERGETEVLDNIPTTQSIADVCTGTNRHAPITYEEHEGAIELMERETTFNEEVTYDDVMHVLRENIQEIPARENVAPNSQRIPSNRQRIEDIQHNRQSRQRIGVQLQEARNKFTEIAEKHAEALKILAEASMKQAENESKRITLEEKRLQIEEKRIIIEGQISRVLANLFDSLK